jgi:cold shock protein
VRIVCKLAQSNTKRRKEQLSMAEHGTIKWYDAAKGQGLIVRDRGEDVFVHHASIIAEGFRTLSEGDRVSFDVVEGPQGLEARNIVKLSHGAKG